MVRMMQDITPGEDHAVIRKVRQALGRRRPLDQVPIPPAIDEPITRLVHTEIGLPDLFARRAADNKIKVQAVTVEQLGAELVAFLRSKNIRSIMIPESALLDRLGVDQTLRAAGFEVRRWTDMTLDQAYDVDCGLSDVYCAVAETGSLVMRPDRGHGRALSLVPALHVAIVEPKNILPDLVDLFAKLSAEPVVPNITLITGPSKTADIEMNLVVGVHGPGEVKVFLLE